MKYFKIFILSVLFLSFSFVTLFSQIQSNPYFSVMTSAIFPDTSYTIIHDEARDVGIYKAYYILSSSLADTIISNPFRTVSGDESLSLDVINVSGTINFTVFYGIFMGAGYGVNGYKWESILAITTAGDTTFSVGSTSWNTDFPSPYHKVKIVETGAQSNKYYLNLIMWRNYK